MVSWGRTDHVISSAPSSAPSILSVDTILFSDMHKKPPDIHRTSRTTDSRIDVMGLPVNAPFGCPRSTKNYPGAGDAFTRHHKYFFKDGNVTFLVDGVLYCVHRYFFSRDSVYFSTRFNKLDTRDHEALPTIISLDDIERKDFDAFLSILYPEKFQEIDLSYEEWESVLHLSTYWDFTSLRELASSVINPSTSHSSPPLVRTYSVKDSIVPALSALCERKAPISLNEALDMKIEDLLLVMTVREGIRNHAIQAYAAEIPLRPAKEKPAQEKHSHMQSNSSTSRSGSHGDSDSDTEAPLRPKGWPVGSSGDPAHRPHFNRLPALTHTINQSGTGRCRPSFESDANDSNRASAVNNAGPSMPMSSMGPMEPISPLEVVERKVKALLNKLTRERFDSISDQIIAWANKSEREKDGRTLGQVIKLVFEAATNDEKFSEMYARLCRKMMEQISPKVQENGIKNAEGKPFAGGQLFRKYLLNRCQEDFERGWVAKEAAAAATKATEDKVVKEANEKTKGGEESELYSEEYYAAAKAKRRGLGLIRFIGELFKLQMLTERIMHECIKKFLDNVENPEEEEIESLCKLLTTVGSLLDTQKARAHFDVYFSRMKELTKNKNVNVPMIFILQDVIELRERRWVPRNAVAATMTVSWVHQEAVGYMRQNASMSRRGGNRDTVQPLYLKGWSVAGSGSPSRQQGKAGDLSQFGKISKATPMSFGPGGVLVSKKGTDPETRDPSITRTPSTSFNTLSMLQNPDAVAEHPSSKGSRPPSRKPSVDLDTGPNLKLSHKQQKLQLLPRSKLGGEGSKVVTPAVSEVGSDGEAAVETGTLAPASISEVEAKAKIDDGKTEFFIIRMLAEAASYFSM